MPIIWIFILFLSLTTAKHTNRLPSTRRSSLELLPAAAITFLQNNVSELVNDEVLSSYSNSFLLQNRLAVERIHSIKERAEEHYPIRDAVEKMPKIDEYLENFRFHTLQALTELEENPYRVVCFLSNWAFYRKGNTKYTPDYVDPYLCTHVVYAYASLNPDNYTIIISDPVIDIDKGFYKKITSAEISNVTKVLISIGGWTDSAGEKYSKLVSSGNNRRRFVNSVIVFLRRYGFHGLHFDWNYPVCWQARCSQTHTADRSNFVKLIQELRQEFNKNNPHFELAISVSGYKEIIDVGYDILNLSENVDFMSVKTYDYHGAWENRTGHLSPLYSNAEDQFPEYSVHSTLLTLVKLGADPKKLIVGLPFYGQSFTLADANNHGLGDDSLKPGEPGEFTLQPGILSYAEICIRVNKEKWQTERNQETGTESYAYKENQWVGYDDKRSLKKKVNYVKKSGYGGVMVWTLDLDDYNNECCTGVYPLLREVNAALGRIQAYDGQSDCSKPIIVPLDNSTNPTSEETTYSSTSSWPWTPIYSTTTTTTEATSLWWPPTLTSRPTTRPTTSVTTTFKTTISTTKPTTSSVSTPFSEEPEETTPSNVDRCVSGKFYMDPTNCGAYFMCVFGKKKRHFCAIGLHWNTKTQTCDWPSKANCLEHLVSTVQTVETTTIMSSTPSHTRPVVGCVNGEYYAVPGDCATFYTCNDGTLYKRRCPNGLNWNQQKKFCDWRENAGCGETSSQDVDIFNEKSSKHDKPKVNKLKLEDGCTVGPYAPHADDCNKFYQCLWGTYKEISCFPGLYWNKEMLICDWPDNVDCVNIEDNESDVPEPQYPSFISSKPTSSTYKSTEFTAPSTTISSPTSAVTTTKSSWKPWTETSSSSSTKIGTKSTPWWTWTESSTSHSENPSTSWEWTPSTTTAATLPTTKPSYSLTGQYKVVCYFTNWAWYRPGSGKYIPEDADPNLCTHIVYGFTVLDYELLTIKVHDSWADIDNRFFERVAAYRKRGVKVTVAIGGWNDSAGDKYSRLVNNPTAIANFISSVLRFIKKYGFDGLDLDWEYPVCWQTNCNQGPASDKAAFSTLVTELRKSFDKYGYLLSSAVSPSKLIIDKGYDVPLLSEKLDWIAVMTYDFHGQWDKKTGHVAPIYYIPGDDYDYFNSYYALNYWIQKGANSQKIVMGMPMYGQGFTLANVSNHGLNAPTNGPSRAGQYTRSSGFLAYYEICEKIKEEQWTVVQDAQGRRGPYAYKNDQWVGYDDAHSIKLKVNLIKKLKLGGGMIWALDLDDFHNICGEGHYPLLSTIARELARPGFDFDIDNSFVTGAGISWSSVSIPTIPAAIVNLTTTRTTTSKRPSKSTKFTSTMYSTTSLSTTPYVTDNTEKNTASNEYTEENNEVSIEWSSSSPTSTYTPQTNDEFKVICYFTNWAWYRQGNGKYMVNDIEPDLCTHIIYAFAVLDPNSLVIKPHDSWADIDNQFYEKVVSLKKRNIKILLAIGGWNDSAGSKYSRLVNSKQARSKFITHVIQFLKKYDFEGLDVDWEYPKCWQVNCKLGPTSDKKAFADFITELRESFNEHGLLLSAAVSANKKVIDEGYDVPLLSNKLDWLSVMVYDYHGQWDEVTGHVAPMYEHPDDFDKTFNANYSIRYWVKKGADPRKIVMGMPMYGQSFTLANSKNNTLNSRAYGGGDAGESTKARGFLAYYEICERILHRGWDIEYDIKGRMGPYAKHGTQWVSFDDQTMIKHKSQYVYYNNLGGAMIWALDLDDFRGVCNCGTYPLLKTINKVLRNYPDDVPECNLESNSHADMKLFYQNEGLELFNDDWKFENCINGEIRKHPTDCTKYLTCSFGVYLQEQPCAVGLHFNEKRSVCDWPENAECKPSIMDYAESYYLNNPQQKSATITNKIGNFNNFFEFLKKYFFLINS
ncbi:hypothetical protein PGB90_007574 [Kerria lacca]